MFTEKLSLSMHEGVWFELSEYQFSFRSWELLNDGRVITLLSGQPVKNTKNTMGKDLSKKEGYNIKGKLCSLGNPHHNSANNVLIKQQKSQVHEHGMHN